MSVGCLTSNTRSILVLIQIVIYIQEFLNRIWSNCKNFVALAAWWRFALSRCL